ncbi:MAG: TetR/AcrR family transcriptional regulator [Eubacteriales bacterium]|nr:TetR/AcrR family transcriptional regulator [Eubacteriales bacterium]
MEDKRSSIIAAAAEAIDRWGSQFTMDMVAQQAGVAKGTVYLYFASKQDLLLSMIMEGLQELEQGLKDAAVGCKDAGGKLAAIVTAHYQMVISKAPLFIKLVSQDPMLFREARPEILPYLKGIEGVYADVLKQGVQEGCFGGINPEITGIILLTLVHNAAASCSIFRPDLSAEAVLEQVQTLIFKGINADPQLAFKNLLQEGKTCKV